MTKIQSDLDYFNYLLNRSIRGLFYRKLVVYWRLNRRCKGLVADIGCGIGDFVKGRKNVVGLDINSQIVDWCQKRGLNVKKMEVDVLPFEDNELDSVILDNVIEHIEKPNKLLSEIERCLSVGGVLLVGVPGKKGFKQDPDHKVFYTEKKIKTLLQTYEFEHTETLYTPFKSDYLDENFSAYCCYTVYKRKMGV